MAVLVVGLLAVRLDLFRGKNAADKIIKTLYSALYGLGCYE